jgi:hypothetical protein
MKGTLTKTINNGWEVRQDHSETDVISLYPLHPYDKFNNNIEIVEGAEVDFVLKDFWNTDLDGKLIKVAVIIDNITDTPKEIGFLGYKLDEMKEDDVEKHISFMKDAGVHEDDIKNWVKGYNKAKKTLYTEEQMIGFAEWILNSDSKKVLTRTKESLLKEYIESLKQAKID